MITGTFNGWKIVALPAAPGFAQMEFAMQDKVSANPSPWTQQAQILDWQVDWWEATASLPPMPRDKAQAWIAFLAECRGMSAVVSVGDPVCNSPLGLARGVPVVNGTNLTRSNTLNVRGFVPNLFRQLRAGDYFQIGYRLHISLEDVNADATGHATINIWPRIREAPADGDPVILHNPKGLFRLADNKRSYSLAVTKLFGMSLTLTEAL